MAKVVVLGGGVAGMSAAHELIERGFDVVVLEKRGIAGGKARSVPVVPSDEGQVGKEAAHAHEAPADAVPWVPGEHGFRFFPGFYKHVVDTMSRIPLRDGETVEDHLVSTTRVGISQYGLGTFEIPARFPRTPGDATTVLGDLLLAFSSITGLRPDDLAHFGARAWQIMTSCAERRIDEYEKIPWWTFIGAESRSANFQKFLAAGITRSLVAAKARTASTRTIGDIFIQLVLTILDPTAETTDRVLDGPTNRVWIHPWRHLLESRGVDYRINATVMGIQCRGSRITGVLVERAGSLEVVEGDYYVCALPIERTVPLLSKEILAADPTLESLLPLSKNVEWMNGVQYYLRRDVPMVHGHMIHIDTQWALTSISQIQFWRPDTLDHYGDPDVKGILSVDVSDWFAPGLNGRCAADCSREEVGRETWEQLKRSVNTTGDEVLSDEDLVGWFLDPDIIPDPATPGRLQNSEPLLVNLVDTWRLRPNAVTAIPNLFLASDYVRTYTDLATMEAANEAARRAVNAILDAEGVSGSRCEIFPLEEPSVLEPWRAYDAARFRVGLPWDRTLLDIAAAGLEAASPTLEGVPALIANVRPVLAPHMAAIAEAGAVTDRALPIEATETALAPVAAAVRTALPVKAVGPVEPDAGAPPAPWSERAQAAPETPAADANEETGPADFLERMGWYRTMTQDELERAVPAKTPDRYLYGLVRDFIARPGKGLRPALCLATCRAYRGRLASALSSAAGIELLHDAFLVHDDIEDGSLSRRGEPTLHQRVGVPLAVNAGDAMLALSMRLFRGNLETLGPAPALRIFDEVDHMLLEALEGQAMELGWVRENDCTVGTDDYLRLVLKKTAWYSFIHPMRIGALAARPDDDDLDRFNRFGFLIGAAFQIQDDVLNLVGHARRYGKEIGGDLWEGKRTLVLAHALAGATPAERGRLEDFFSRPRERRLPRQLEDVYDVLHRRGSIDWARRAGSALVAAAQEELPVAFDGASDGPDLNFVRSLVTYLVERDK